VRLSRAYTDHSNDRSDRGFGSTGRGARLSCRRIVAHCPPFRFPVAASLVAGFLLAACGARSQAGPFRAIADDASAQSADEDAGHTTGNGADAAPPLSSEDGDSAAFDGAAIVILPDDASLLGAPSNDGGIDPTGPCPAAVAGWTCSVEGAHLCGDGCSMQCYCADGYWLCHLPPC
jgi:hypothetical protein